MKLGITRTLPGISKADFEGEFDEIYGPFDGVLEEAEIAALAQKVDVLLITLRDRITADILDQAPQLKLIVTFSVGVDHIAVSKAVAGGVRVSNTPSVLTDATADLAFALLLGCVRRVKPALRLVEDGLFQGFEPSLFLGKALDGAKLGVVGMGKIGTAVAKRALGFGMDILYSGRERELPFEARCLDLHALLRESSVVTLHCPLTPETQGLIGRKELSLMPDDGVLINTARGPVVDEGALLAHLRSHPDFYAGLDVYEFEPEITEGLASLPNVLCLPHIGSATKTARHAMAKVNREEVLRFACGEPLRYEVSSGGGNGSGA